MTVPQVRFDDRGEQIPFTEQEIDLLVPVMAGDYAPRRFALCEVVRDDGGLPLDVMIIAWGLETADSVSVVGYPDEAGVRVNGTFASAESAACLLAAGGDLRVAWADSAR